MSKKFTIQQKCQGPSSLKLGQDIQITRQKVMLGKAVFPQHLHKPIPKQHHQMSWLCHHNKKNSIAKNVRNTFQRKISLNSIICSTMGQPTINDNQ